ncbi:MAG: nitroreductase family protein [Candidatus Hermodarchaeota archaeon]
MKFSGPIVEVIQRRVSWRDYIPQPLEDAIKDRIVKFLQTEKKSPLGGELRFELIEMPELDPKEKKQLGTYGFIKGAQYFIVAAMHKSKYDLENLGYLMEEIILFATDLGLGTCWLGGTFKRSAFAAQINVTSDETVPVITPIGYPTQNRSFRNNTLRWIARSKKRFPWDALFFESNFSKSLTQEAAAEYAIPLEMVRLSPSASNRQPWRVLKELKHHNYHFYIHRRGKTRFFSSPDFPRIDLGICICHFDLTLQELNLKGRWEFFNPDIDSPNHLEYVASWIAE